MIQVAANLTQPETKRVSHTCHVIRVASLRSPWQTDIVKLRFNIEVQHECGLCSFYGPPFLTRCQNSGLSTVFQETLVGSRYLPLQRGIQRVLAAWAVTARATSKNDLSFISS